MWLCRCFFRELAEISTACSSIITHFSQILYNAQTDFFKVFALNSIIFCCAKTSLKTNNRIDLFSLAIIMGFIMYNIKARRSIRFEIDQLWAYCPNLLELQNWKWRMFTSYVILFLAVLYLFFSSNTGFQDYLWIAVPPSKLYI